MLSERQADAVVVWAPAKVNLFLELLAKRADGYHEIATLLVAVSLYDTLELKEDASGQITLESTDPQLPTGPENLIWRATQLLQQKLGLQRGVRLRLVKRIPLAAGLAGGSSDAAATLAGLNRLWKLGLSRAELAGLGAELGSDVAFFFSTPAAWCTGRGEVVAPLALPGPLWFVLMCPPFGLSTAEVYRRVKVPEQPQTGVALRQAVAEGAVEKLGGLLHNRLQPAALELRPELAGYLSRLAELAPAGQAMSGSGSCLFALCRDFREAVRLARRLRNRSEEGMNPRVFIVRSCV
jgi:4-diphosphocytidyl-2-C-methyl-D-erythritol kinase